MHVLCIVIQSKSFLESASRPEVFVAIKVLLEEFSHSEEAISLLKDETTKTQQLSHPNIVKVYSIEAVAKQLFAHPRHPPSTPVGCGGFAWFSVLSIAIYV